MSSSLFSAIPLLNNPQVLKELKKHIVPGALYNSVERDSSQRCHPGTRTSIRDRLKICIGDPTLEKRVIWIHGPAGVGKSAIMQTIVEEVIPDFICGTLFCSRLHLHDDTKKAFPTLAYGLAVANEQYRYYLGMRLKSDPTYLTQSLDNQFKALFVTPFVQNHVQVGPRRWVMFLDGLDECQITEHTDNQRRIMNFICDSIFDHPQSTPFIWIIASRPEENLKKVWHQAQGQFGNQVPKLEEITIPIHSGEGIRDVELYLYDQFEAIRANHFELMSTRSRWPSDQDFAKVANESSGLFVFASTVVNYLSSFSVEDPVFRLEVVMAFIDRADKCSPDENPFRPLDSLYSTIMANISMRLLPVTKSLLGFYHLLDTVFSEDLGTYMIRRDFVTICNFLGLRQNEAYAAVRKLRSVLKCPPPLVAHVKGIQVFHASFLDFLLDDSRSKIYHINPDQELNNVWRCCIKIINDFANKQGKLLAYLVLSTIITEPNSISHLAPGG